MLSTLLSGLAAKIFATSVAVVTVAGGVAATGALPDAVQDPLATVYNTVGFDFPTSDEDVQDESVDYEADDSDEGNESVEDEDAESGDDQ